jgi:hypothetical protein
MLISGKKLTLGILATITLEVAPFCAYAIVLQSSQLCQNGAIINWGNRDDSQGAKSGE